MKIASIILPIGVRHADDAHTVITSHLVEHYNGYTRTEGQGAWSDVATRTVVHEPVYRYDFAAEDRAVVADDLRALAFKVKTITDEQSVMIILTNGKVEFI